MHKTRPQHFSNVTAEEWDLYETGYTDDTGYVTFEDLPFGDYRVYEIGQLDDDGNLTTPRCKTCDTALSTLVEPIEVTLPLKMTESSGFSILPIITVGMAFATVGAYLVIRRRRYLW